MFGAKSQRVAHVLSDIDLFNSQKLYPGTKEAPFVAQGHTVGVPSKTLHCSNVQAGLNSSSGYLVVLYAPTIWANSSSRWSGFSYMHTAGMGTNVNISST